MKRKVAYFSTYKIHSNRKGECYLSFCSYPIRQTSMNVPVIMVDVATCVTIPLEISTVHVDLDTHYKKTTLLVLVSVMQCYVLCEDWSFRRHLTKDLQNRRKESSDLKCLDAWRHFLKNGIKSFTIDDLGIVGFFPATIGDLGIISLLCDYNWELFGVSTIALWVCCR